MGGAVKETDTPSVILYFLRCFCSSYSIYITYHDIRAVGLLVNVLHLLQLYIVYIPIRCKVLGSDFPDPISCTCTCEQVK